MPKIRRAFAGSLARREVESYLRASGLLARPTLGPTRDEARKKETARGPGERTAPAADPLELARSIGAAQQANHRIFSLCLGALGFLFVLQSGVVVHGVFSGYPLGWALSATLTIWPAVWWLRRLWLDRLLLGEIHLLLRELPPEKAIEVLQIIYWGPLRPKR